MSHPDYEHIGDPEDRVNEEIGEYLQALGKCKRFGYFNRDPRNPEAKTNIDQLRYEIDDAIQALGKMDEKLATLQRIYDRAPIK